jgi:hypothetical protein
MFAARTRADGSDLLRIRWVAPLDCPRGDFDRELTRLLGDTPPPAQAEVDVSALPDGPRRYHLSLQLMAAGQPAVRELELASCADVRHAAALLIATALQAADDSPPTAAGRGLQLRLGVLGDALSLPAITGGPELGVAWRAGGLRLALEGRYLLARGASDDDSQLRTDVDLLAGSVGAQYLFALGPLGIGPGLAVEVGRLGARATGEQARNQGTLWASALVGARAELPLSHSFGLMLAAQLSVPLRRPSLSLEGEAPFYETRRAGLRLAIGVIVQLGDKRSSGAGQ